MSYFKQQNYHLGVLKSFKVAFQYFLGLPWGIKSYSFEDDCLLEVTRSSPAPLVNWSASYCPDSPLSAGCGQEFFPSLARHSVLLLGLWVKKDLLPWARIWSPFVPPFLSGRQSIGTVTDGLAALESTSGYFWSGFPVQATPTPASFSITQFPLAALTRYVCLDWCVWMKCRSDVSLPFLCFHLHLLLMLVLPTSKCCHE